MERTPSVKTAKDAKCEKGKGQDGEGDGEMRNVLFPGGAESEVAKC